MGWNSFSRRLGALFAAFVVGSGVASEAPKESGQQESEKASSKEIANYSVRVSFNERTKNLVFTYPILNSHVPGRISLARVVMADNQGNIDLDEVWVSMNGGDANSFQQDYMGKNAPAVEPVQLNLSCWPYRNKQANIMMSRQWAGVASVLVTSGILELRERVARYSFNGVAVSAEVKDELPSRIATTVLLFCNNGKIPDDQARSLGM